MIGRPPIGRLLIFKQNHQLKIVDHWKMIGAICGRGGNSSNLEGLIWNPNSGESEDESSDGLKN